jgi:hypothetical protein
MNRIALLIILFVLSFGVKAQLVAEPLRTAKDTANGMIYSLPRTLLEIEVDTKCTEEVPGPYFQYAERFLGTKDFIQEKNIRYELTGYRMFTKSVADTSQTYLISTGKKGKNIRLEFTSDGFLASINGKGTAPSTHNLQPNNNDKSDEIPQLAEWNTDNTSLISKEMQQAGSTAKMAELAANQIFSIREARFNILTQDLDKTPNDGRSYEIVLGELNRMERYYLELFQGKRTVITQTTRFVFNPIVDTTDVLFRFSTMIGVLDKTNLGGEPYFISIKRLPCMADSLKADVGGLLVKGVYYRSPGKALIQLSTVKNTLYSDVFTINQLGRVLSIPSTQFRSLDICPVTGGLIRMER